MKLTDLKVYLKFLSRNKLYTLVSVAGLGISLMFVMLLGTYVRHELSAEEFQENKERIFLAGNEKGAYTPNPMAGYLMERYPEIESYTRILIKDYGIATDPDNLLTATAMFADTSFFNIFSYKLLDGDPSQVLIPENSAVITRSFANRLFGNEEPVGKSLYIQGGELLITGLMEDIPDNTKFPQVDLILPYSGIKEWWGNDILQNWGNASFSTYLLLREGADLNDKKDAIIEDLKTVFFGYRDGFIKELRFIKLKDAYFENISSINEGLKSNSKTTVMVYMAIAMLIMVVAMLNYINMTMAQAGFRGKEAAMRKLLGSGRGELIRQFLSESLLMTFAAFAIGVLLAFVMEPYFSNLLSTNLNLAGQTGPGSIAFVILLVLLTAFVSGIIPAFVISRFNPLEVVKGTFSKKVKSSYSKILIVFQYSVTLILLMCSVFIMRQSNFLLNYDIGLNTDKVLYMGNVADARSARMIRDEFMTISGIEKIGLSRGIPFQPGSNWLFALNDEPLSFEHYIVDSAFLDIFGIDITPTDIPVSDRTVWLNQKGYNAINPDPVTKSFKPDKNTTFIAGITNDFHIRPLHEPEGLIMMSFLSEDRRPNYFTVKLAPSASPMSVVDQLREMHSKYLNGFTDFDIVFFDDKIQNMYEKEVKTSKIINSFTLLTLVIMIMGIFAMSLYTVRQKEKEIGVRKVNGATVGEILVMINIQSLLHVGIAFVIACPVSYFVISRWLDNFAYRVPVSWWVFILAGLIVAALTVTAISWQSWRTATANPVNSLKSE